MSKVSGLALDRERRRKKHMAALRRHAPFDTVPSMAVKGTYRKITPLISTSEER